MDGIRFFEHTGMNSKICQKFLKSVFKPFLANLDSNRFIESVDNNEILNLSVED